MVYADLGRRQLDAALAAHPLAADRAAWASSTLSPAARTARATAFATWLIAWPLFMLAGRFMAATARH
ncbi:TPA: hypothetical protein VMX41_001795 [Streptococcus pyogenes]|nr:hypothetical protein [Streptococcus pyogenes]